MTGRIGSDEGLTRKRVVEENDSAGVLQECECSESLKKLLQKMIHINPD